MRARFDVYSTDEETKKAKRKTCDTFYGLIYGIFK